MKKSKYDNAKIEQANIGESGEAVKVGTFEMVAKIMMGGGVNFSIS